jgi:hypothetical protein
VCLDGVLNTGGLRSGEADGWGCVLYGLCAGASVDGTVAFRRGIIVSKFFLLHRSLCRKPSLQEAYSKFVIQEVVG